MDVFWQFICDHRHAVVEFILLICVLFVTIFKKKVKIHDTFEIILLTLPDLIIEAESLHLVGSDKYSFVFNKCIELIQSLTHQSKQKIIDEYTSLIDVAIEDILATPQKKGGK